MKLFNLKVNYQWSIRRIIKYILLLSSLELSLEAMQKCPDCAKGSYQILFIDRNNLYNAVKNKDIVAIRDILSCDVHKKPQMKYVNLYYSTECNAFLQAIIDSNYLAIEELVKAGDDITFTNRIGVNVFNYQGHKDRQKTMTTIIGSLQTGTDVDRFCRGLADLDITISRKIFCTFLKLAGSKYFKFQRPEWYRDMREKNFAGPYIQNKLKQFRDIQKKKIHVLLEHAQGVNGKLPADVTNYIADMVFPENDYLL